MNKKEKLKDLSKALPLIWNSYQHMYDVRIRGQQDIRNFLLISFSFLILSSISLILTLKNNFILLPIIFQLIGLAILFKTIFIGTVVHWFEYNELLGNIEKGNFERNLLADLKSIENWTWKYIKEMEKIIEQSLYYLILSIYTTLMIVILSYIEFPINQFLSLILTLSILVLFKYYKKQPLYQHEKEYSKFIEEIDRWLEK